MFRGPYFIVSTMKGGTTPIFKVFGMTRPSSNRESNPQILLVSAGSPLSSPFTISRGFWGPIHHQGAPWGSPTPDAHRVSPWEDPRPKWRNACLGSLGNSWSGRALGSGRKPDEQCSQLTFQGVSHQGWHLWNPDQTKSTFLQPLQSSPHPLLSILACLDSKF